MGAVIDRDGVVSYDDLGHRWASLHDLASDYWRWQRLSGQAKQEDEMAAWSCVDDLMRTPVPQALDVIQALLDLAETDQEVCNVAAGPLEDLLSHFGHGEQFVAEVERRGERDPKFRKALACLYLGDDVPIDVRARLEPPSRWD